MAAIDVMSFPELMTLIWGLNMLLYWSSLSAEYLMCACGYILITVVLLFEHKWPVEHK